MVYTRNGPGNSSARNERTNEPSPSEPSSRSGNRTRPEEPLRHPEVAENMNEVWSRTTPFDHTYGVHDTVYPDPFPPRERAGTYRSSRYRAPARYSSPPLGVAGPSNYMERRERSYRDERRYPTAPQSLPQADTSMSAYQHNLTFPTNSNQTQDENQAAGWPTPSPSDAEPPTAYARWYNDFPTASSYPVAGPSSRSISYAGYSYDRPYEPQYTESAGGWYEPTATSGGSSRVHPAAASGSLSLHTHSMASEGSSTYAHSAASRRSPSYESYAHSVASSEYEQSIASTSSATFPPAPGSYVETSGFAYALWPMVEAHRNAYASSSSRAHHDQQRDREDLHSVDLSSAIPFEDVDEAGDEPEASNSSMPPEEAPRRKRRRNRRIMDESVQGKNGVTLYYEYLELKRKEESEGEGEKGKGKGRAVAASDFNENLGCWEPASSVNTESSSVHEPGATAEGAASASAPPAATLEEYTAESGPQNRPNDIWYNPDIEATLVPDQKASLREMRAQMPGDPAERRCTWVGPNGGRTCTKLFSDSRTRNKHVRHRHLDIKFPCVRCGSLFAREDSFRRHLSERDDGGRTTCERRQARAKGEKVPRKKIKKRKRDVDDVGDGDGDGDDGDGGEDGEDDGEDDGRRKRRR